MSNPYNCSRCGDWCDGRNEHVCQDTQDRARIEALEQQVDALEQQVDALRTLVLKLWSDQHTEQEWEATPEEWAAALRVLEEDKQ